MCNVKGDKPTEIYLLTLQFPSALQNITVFLSSFSWSETLLFWFSLTALISLISNRNRQLFSVKKKSDKPTAHYLSRTKQWTDKVRNQPVDKVEHLA